MSYYASGCGDFTLKEGILALPDNVLERILSTFSEHDVYKDPRTGRTALFIGACDIYYSDDDVEEALNTLLPFITEGAISFEGEDGSKWQYYFDASSGQFKDRKGEVCYCVEDAKKAFLPDDPVSQIMHEFDVEWTKEDVINAMEEACITVSPENLEKVKTILEKEAVFEFEAIKEEFISAMNDYLLHLCLDSKKTSWRIRRDHENH